MSFFAKIIGFFLNDALVKGLANNRLFQRFALKTDAMKNAGVKAAEENLTKATTIAEQKLKEEAVRIKNAQPSSADPDKFDFRLFLKEFTEEIQGSAGKGPASKAVQKSKQSQNSNKK